MCNLIVGIQALRMSLLAMLAASPGASPCRSTHPEDQPNLREGAMRYRRIYVKGGTYFFTVVTYQRVKLFTNQINMELLNDAFDYVHNRHPFNIIAQVILPDHIHTIWELPEGDSDYPTRWYLCKSYFSRNFNRLSSKPASFRASKGERTVWQRRYWEHTIKNDKDLDNHIDYIHFNPVHHGLVEMPAEWIYSSFDRFVQEGRYDADWTIELDEDNLKTAGE
jgi:putative transposase